LIRAAVNSAVIWLLILNRLAYHPGTVKVRDVLRLLKDDGWSLVSTVGSHRQLKHPAKPGRVTVSGHPSDDSPKNPKEYLDASGLEEIEFHIMRYAMIIEPGERNYSAYLPDLPGCVATGKTIEELRQRMSEAIELHLDGMREDGLPIPEPTSLADYVEAA
jgi:predicted RNase H-like HicB family nuclease/predicted RNA binding protein YcfA (HicA-like mRNA interferase family)